MYHLTLLDRTTIGKIFAKESGKLVEDNDTIGEDGTTVTVDDTYMEPSPTCNSNGLAGKEGLVPMVISPSSYEQDKKGKAKKTFTEVLPKPVLVRGTYLERHGCLVGDEDSLYMKVVQVDLGRRKMKNDKFVVDYSPHRIGNINYY